MEHQNSTNKNTSSPTTKNCDDGRHPAAADAGAEDTGETHQLKKRKSCPIVADNGVALIKKKKKKTSPLNSSYSFTFDTKICGGSGFPNTPEPTPKFGSFNPDPGSAIRSKDIYKQEGDEEQSVD